MNQTTIEKPKKETARQAILRVLGNARRPMAIHELEIIGHSQISLARRIYELAREGKVASVDREGKNFKEWALADAPGSSASGSGLPQAGR